MGLNSVIYTIFIYISSKLLRCITANSQDVFIALSYFDFLGGVGAAIASTSPSNLCILVLRLSIFSTVVTGSIPVALPCSYNESSQDNNITH